MKKNKSIDARMLCMQMLLIKCDNCFDSRLVTERFQALFPLLQLECFVNNAVNFDFAGIEVSDSTMWVSHCE